MAQEARIEGLDLLRGFAIFLVLVRHSWPEPFGGAGIVGVVVFFALSGYLITGLLMSDLQRFGKVRYGRFYFHRAIRLLPALVALLVVYGVVNVIFDPLREGLRLTARAIFTAITYTGNIPGQPRGAPLGHLWTLATEEQFYLVWPLLLAAVGFRLRSLLLAALLGFVIVGGGLALHISARADDIASIYTMPFSWALAMMIGAAARLGNGQLDRVLPAAGAPRGLLSLAVMGVLVGFCFLPEVKAEVLMYVLGGPVIAICTVVLLFHLKTWSVVPTALLRPMLWLGTVSYAAYLWNYPITKWLAGADQVLDGWTPVMAVVATVAAATVSWFVVEQPARRLRDLIDRRRGSSVGAPGDLAPVPVA